MTARQPSVFKTFSRRFRLWLYHLRRGPLFDFHGVRIALPERIGFRFKRQINRIFILTEGIQFVFGNIEAATYFR